MAELSHRGYIVLAAVLPYEGIRDRLPGELEQSLLSILDEEHGFHLKPNRSKT